MVGLLTLQIAAAKPDASLNKAQKSFDARKYARVVRITEQILERPGRPELHRRAKLLRGCSFVMLGRESEAEAVFTELLADDPSVALPARAALKVVKLFDAVRSKLEQEQEQARAAAQEAAQEQERAEEEAQTEARAAAQPQIVGGPISSGPAAASPRGGEPLALSFTVVDPGNAVTALELSYRRAGQVFATVPLDLDPVSGRFETRLPATWTDSEEGFTLEYAVTGRDANGEPLAYLGAMDSPLRLDIASGQLAGASPLYASVWLWTAVAVVVAGAATGTFLIVDNRRQIRETDLGTIDFRGR